MKFLSTVVVAFVCFCLYCCRNATEKKSIATNSKDSTSWALLGFEKADSINPILAPGKNSFIDPITKQKIYWEERNVFNPAIVVKGDTVFMLYRAQDNVGKPGGTSRVALAYSLDGLHFTRYAAPVLYPANDNLKKYEWQGGCEDPRVVQDNDGTYFMYYTSYDGTLARLLVASSKDLRHWTKYGSVFNKAYNGKYKNLWSKSGSVVSTYKNGSPVATKVNGKYWMYWGDQFIWAATSDDLINWTPVEMQADEKPSTTLKGQALNMPLLHIVIPTRNKKFDSDLVEPGPPAILTGKGIVLIYNSRNIPGIGDTSLTEGTYAAGEVLIDKNNPLKVIGRLENYIMKPDKPYELTGEVNHVCFLEGLAYFKDQWLVYYGTADSKIAVAASKQPAFTE